jgi:hypothetical protein
MPEKLWDLVFDYLKAKPYWQAIEPYVLIAFGWVAAQVVGYEWLSASGFRPTIALFLGSYISIRITIVALGVVGLLLVLRTRRRETKTDGSRIGAYWRTHRRAIMRRTLGVVFVCSAVLVGFILASPNRVSHITVRLMSLDADVTPEAVAYVIYELNRQQRSWYFDVVFTSFSEDELTSTDAERCRAADRPRLCHAEALAEGQPFIGITNQSLGGAYFAEHRGPVSVISTADKEAYEPLSTYEYLAFSLILQGIAIHLDLHGGLPADAFAERRASHGGLLQFVPQPEALKSSILAARLSPDEESLLLNRFGANYVATCSSLLTMEWLYSDRVRGNLEKAFDATLGR